MATPDTVDLTAAAAAVVYERHAQDRSTDPWDRGRWSGVLAVWQALTGITSAVEAEACAEALADSTTTVTAVVPPF